MAVIMPQPLMSGQKFEMEFVYSGEVLAEAGDGLLYVGARGTWYPNRGMEMADFDLQFSYPPEWTLVATGKAGAIRDREHRTSKWRTDITMDFGSIRSRWPDSISESTGRRQAKAGDVRLRRMPPKGSKRTSRSQPIREVPSINPNRAVRAPQLDRPTTSGARAERSFRGGVGGPRLSNTLRSDSVHFLTAIWR